MFTKARHLSSTPLLPWLRVSCYSPGALRSQEPELPVSKAHSTETDQIPANLAALTSEALLCLARVLPTGLWDPMADPRPPPPVPTPAGMEHHGTGTKYAKGTRIRALRPLLATQFPAALTSLLLRPYAIWEGGACTADANSYRCSHIPLVHGVAALALSFLMVAHLAGSL